MDAKFHAIRAGDEIAISPYTFNAGEGPGVNTLTAILNLAKMFNCALDAGTWPGPVYLRSLPKSDDDLRTLLELIAEGSK